MKPHVMKVQITLISRVVTRPSEMVALEDEVHSVVSALSVDGWRAEIGEANLAPVRNKRRGKLPNGTLVDRDSAEWLAYIASGGADNSADDADDDTDSDESSDATKSGKTRKGKA